MEVCKWKERPDDGRMDGWDTLNIFIAERSLVGSSVTRLGNLLDFRQVFIAFGKN